MSHTAIGHIRGALYLAVLFLSAAGAAAQAPPTTVTAVLNGSANDAEQESGGAMRLTDQVLRLGGQNRLLGLRFTNLNIPKGVKIDSAHITFEAAILDAGSAEFKIEVGASDTAEEFKATDNNISNRSRFSTAVGWNTSDWWISGTTHQTPDLRELVQKVVDLEAWGPGDVMAFFFSSGKDVYRRARSFDDSPSKAPKLTVVYSVYKLEVPTLKDAGSDDLFQKRSNTSNQVFNAGSIELGSIISGTVTCAGLRFQNVDLPEGAQIMDARLTFKAWESAPAGTSTKNVTIVGEKVLGPKTYATSPNPSTHPDLPINRKANSPLTTSAVVWNNIPAWQVGSTYSSPSIANIIQEIVTQQGWHAYSPEGFKAISLLLSGNELRKVYSSNDGQTHAPLLYIEYTLGDPTTPGQPRMSIAADQLSLSRSCNQGQTALSSQFKLANIGTGQLNYSVAVNYATGAGWLALSPGYAGTMTLASGAEQLFTLAYQPNLSPGEYKATVRLSGPNSQPTTYDIAVVLTVNPPATACEDYPLYTKQSSSPAALILLDLSESMGEFVDVTAGVSLPRSPNLKSLVKHLVSKTDWAPGNSMVFNIRRASGSPVYKARSYDGSTASSPMLEITYIDGGGKAQTVNVRVKKEKDDGHVADVGGSLKWLTKEAELELGSANGYGLFLHFSNIDVPKNAYITEASIVFVPTQTAAGDLTLSIRVEDSGDPRQFNSGNSPLQDSPARTWYPAGPISSGISWTPGSWTAVTSRRKIEMAKEAILNLVASDQSVSWGFGTWAQPTAWQTTGEDPQTYTRVHVGCKPYSNQHKNDLMAAIDGTTVAGSMTPFGPSLLGAAKYFSGQKPAENGGMYSAPACQSKILINVSDGNGNLDSTEDTVAAHAKTLAAAGVSVAGIGFMLPADEGTCLRKLAVVSNQEADAVTDDAVYALHPVQNGVATYFNAGNESELLSTFQTIIGSFKKATYFASTPAPTSLQVKDRILVGAFNTQTWTGDLLSIMKDQNGKWQKVEWSAYQKLGQRPANEPRSVWTVESLAGVNHKVAYTDEDVLCKKIGPIINSAPTLAGPPAFHYTFDDYPAFKRARGQRDTMVYVGANDGLLHAFKLDDGSEAWAFMPPNVKARLEDQYLCLGSYCHRYFMDGSPKLADVRTRINNQNEWRTLLVAGQRQGGAAYTALDVTSGKPFDDASDPSRFLWEFKDADLGESWSEPEIERVRDGNGTAWGVFFSSGYAEDESQQANKEAYLYALEAYSGQPLWASGAKIRLGASTRYRLYYDNYSSDAEHVKPKPGLWVHRSWGYWQDGSNAPQVCNFQVKAVEHDLPTRKGWFEFDADSIRAATPPYGECFETNFKTYFNVLDGPGTYVNWAQNAWSTGPPAPLALANNVLNSPLVVDLDGDRKADVVYTGDLYGNMHRVVNIGKGETPAASVLFKFDPVPTNPMVSPIRGKATCAYSSASNLIWVYYGTGRYETEADKSSMDTQFFFGLKDLKIAANTAPPAPYALGSLAMRATQTLTHIESGRKVRTVRGNDNAGASWAVRLGDGNGGERVFTKPLAAGGIVFFTTFTPDNSGCGGGGDAYVFALDYATGLPPSHPVFDLNGDGKFDNKDKVKDPDNETLITPAGVYIGRGTGSQPVLFKDTLFISTTVPQLGVLNAGSGTGGGLHALAVNIPRLKIRTESWKHD
jgi:hypothetical protein